MRIERPNPTRNSDIRLQNSSNNLINRQMNMRYSMLAWHSTGINGMRANHVRTEVLARVHAANPPLPPNSTRGLTPGLINPLLGNVPGNLIPFPPLGNSQGRLRASGRPQATQAAAAAAPQALANTAQSNAAQANPPQPNQVQATLTQNNPGRNSRGHVRRIPRKRNHTSPDTNSRPLKRQSLGFNNDDMDDNMNDNMDEDMDAPSDGHESSEVCIDTPDSLQILLK